MIDDELKPAKRSKRVTSNDVARELGVSRATVSYVLNDTPGTRISERTRALVVSTAERLGHVPSAAGRSLRLGRSDLVLALVRSYSGTGFIAHRTLERLDDALTEQGYVLTVHRYAPELRQLPELWKLISPSLVVAMGGLSVPDVAEIEDAQIKLVVAQGLLEHERAGAMQVEYLHSRGHRRLGYAFPTLPSAPIVAEQRLRGAQAAAKRLGLPRLDVREVNIEAVDSVSIAVRQWLEGGQISAVCAHNDDIALMIVVALGMQGSRSPEDLAVIGVDDIPQAQLGITTIGVDIEGYSREIVDMVLAQLEDREPSALSNDLLRVVQRQTA